MRELEFEETLLVSGGAAIANYQVRSHLPLDLDLYFSQVHFDNIDEFPITIVQLFSKN